MGLNAVLHASNKKHWMTIRPVRHDHPAHEVLGRVVDFRHALGEIQDVEIPELGLEISKNKFAR